MKTIRFHRPLQGSGQVSRALLGLGPTVFSALLLATAHLVALPAVDTLTGGPSELNPQFYGYVDGDTTTVAQFHTPIGLALDSTGAFLYVADRDNNAIRVLDLAFNETFTIAPNGLTPAGAIANPVGVALDGDDNAYVLNRGNGNDGTLVLFDYYGNLIGTKAVALTNANAITLDSATNAYVTAGNTLLQITPGGVKTTIATVTNAGAVLQGLVIMDSGWIAAADSGRHGILLINPVSGVISNLTGFNGVGDYTGLNNRGATKATAQFNQPYGLAKAGNDFLVVSDFGNNRVKVVNSVGTVTNLYGVSSNLWFTGPGANPGWWDGTVVVPDAVGDVEAREPRGVLFAGDSAGTVYVTEDYYHLIRKVTGANLPPIPPPPPPPPPVPAPAVGWVDFTLPPSEIFSILRTNQPFVFNNDVIIAIAGTAGAETHYTFGATGSSIPNPNATTGSTPPPYHDGMFPSQVPLTIVPPQPGVYPDFTVKAIGTAPGRQSSFVVSARFVFKTANPVVTGNNGAKFLVTDQTGGAQMWYTTDGTDPTNSLPSLGPITTGASLSLNVGSGVTFKVRGFRDNYQPSEIVSTFFSSTNFVPNSISFGFAAGEASSDFVASPGQFFYAPVTLNPLPNALIYSLQFNLTVTNGGPNPGPALASGTYSFQSFLEKPIPGTSPVLYKRIPPLMFIANASDPPPAWAITNWDGGSFVNMMFTNSALNLLGVGWLERLGQTNLYPTMSQTLISYSQAHDTLFTPATGKVILGGYAFRVPSTAAFGQTYQMQIGRPSATADGVGAPGSDVYISTPTNGSLASGAMNSVKVVTTGQRKYVAGDCAPFRWFNAGDYGNTNLDNSDVMQVFQSAIYELNKPPAGSDFFDSMDSCGGLGVLDSSTGYYTNAGPLTLAQQNALFDGNDTLINQIAFGNVPQTNLDVCDIYVTFRRSLDPSLSWFNRFWNNGILAAESVYPQPNLEAHAYTPLQPKLSASFLTNPPSINFATADLTASAGQTLQIPVTAKVFGDYPLRVLMLNLSVEPLDGSPALTSPIQFKPNAALGSAALASSTGNGNYAATWLDSSIAGLTGNATLGTLTVTIPAGAPSSAAYAIHFDHASASPNGIASFPNRALTGLILLSDRSSSIYSDGIPDSWRLRYFGTVNNALSQAAADADGDGASNWHEYIAGTDPSDATSRLRVATDQAAARQSQDCVVHWPSVAGKRYIIERSTSLFGPNWIPVSTNTGSGTDMEFHDMTGGAVRFYRVRVAP